MSRARSHSLPNMMGKLSRSEVRTRDLVSATVQLGRLKASKVALRPAVTPAQASTRVLSQS